MQKVKFVQDLQKQAYQYIGQDFSHIIVLCVGTNKLIGDCIGPMVGQKLISILKPQDKVIVYGNMIDTLNFRNAKSIIENIFKIYNNPFMITVDSALGTEKMIKKLIVNKGPIQIGDSLGRSICYFSHINIKGVVGENKDVPRKNIETLKNVRPEIIIDLSNIVAYGVSQVIEKIGIAD